MWCLARVPLYTISDTFAKRTARYFNSKKTSTRPPSRDVSGTPGRRTPPARGLPCWVVLQISHSTEEITKHCKRPAPFVPRTYGVARKRHAGVLSILYFPILAVGQCRLLVDASASGMGASEPDCARHRHLLHYILLEGHPE